MKKFSAFILALLYITTSSGVMISKHYCMGKLVASTFSQNKDQDCSYCGMKETIGKGCCENKQKFLKINKDQKIAVTQYSVAQFKFAAINNPVLGFNVVTIPSYSLAHPFIIRFIRCQNLPLYVLNSVFLI
ncbi:MAG: hypothetical protein ABIN97_17120 [Ginsengibacter sp.]